jgi:hypothetical protein
MGSVVIWISRGKEGMGIVRKREVRRKMGGKEIEIGLVGRVRAEYAAKHLRPLDWSNKPQLRQSLNADRQSEDGISKGGV